MITPSDPLHAALIGLGFGCVILLVRALVDGIRGSPAVARACVLVGVYVWGIALVPLVILGSTKGP